MVTEQAILDWAQNLETQINNDLLPRYPGSQPRFIEVKRGRNYSKIVPSYHGSRSVHCFVVNETGGILMAASWKAPAKHIRGNIADPNGGWGTAVGPFGASYLR